MSDLSLEDQNFAEAQTELIAEHDAPDDFTGDVILEIRPAFRDEDHFAPLQRLTAVQAFGANNPTTQDGGIGVLGFGTQDHSGIGVKGIGNTGVRGESAKLSDAHGVIGVVRGSPVITPFLPSAGILGQGFGLEVPGIRGEGEFGPGVQGSGHIGVQGVTDLSGIGVQGLADQGQGVWGQSKTGPGVFGRSDDGNAVAAFSNNGNAVDATSSSGLGVRAVSNRNHGVLGDNRNQAVTPLAGAFARTSGCYGATLNNRGVSGVVGLEDWNKNKPEAIDAFATGVFGQAGLFFDPERRVSAKGFAGIFLGPVVTWGPFVNYGGPKSAAVPHPDGSHRLLYCMESPESWFEDFGEAKLVKGKAAVKIDKDFAGVTKTDNYHVFLSPYGESNGLYVSRRNRNGFEVREQSGGRSSLTFSYRVVARRKDVPTERFPKFDVPSPIVKAFAKQKSGNRKRSKRAK
jgi:hypothetical protein